MASRSGGSKPSYLKNKTVDDDGINMDEDFSEDDDLFANFNATSSNKASNNAKGSSYPKPMSRNLMSDEGFSSQKSLMMTMKKPLQPTSSKRPISPPGRGLIGQLGPVGEQESESESFSDEDLRQASNKPSFLRNQQPKSPSLQKREVAAAPKPQPRQRSIESKSPSANSRTETGSRRDSYDSVDGMIPDDRRMPLSSRNTPIDHRKSPYDERRDIRTGGDSKVDHRKSPAVLAGDRRKSGASDLPEYRATPVDRLKSPYEESRSPLDHRKSPADNYDDLFRARSQGTVHVTGVTRKSPLDKSLFDEEISPRKSPREKIKSSSGQKSPLDSRSSPESRKSPLDANSKHQKGVSGLKDRDSPAVQNKRSVMDFLTETNGHQDDHLDHAENGRRRASQTGRKTPVKESNNPFEHVRKSPSNEMNFRAVHDKSPVTRTQDKSKSRRQPLKREEDESHSDGDSSVCEELVEEPVKQKKSDKSDTVTEVRAKSQTSSHKKADDAIELVKDAQSGNKMKYIESTDGGKSSKRPASASSTSGSSSKVVKPQPRYAKPSVPKTPAAASPNFDSTGVIRDAVFEEWKGKRLQRAKQELMEKKRKEKEIEDKKLREEEEKRDFAKKAYEAWVDGKKDYVSEKTKKKREEEEKAMKEEEEKRKKKDDAEMTFKQWKASADVQLKEKHKDSLRKTKKIEEAKKEKEEDKKKEAESAYHSWKNKKDEIIYKSHEEQVKAQKKKEREKKEEAEREAKEARAAYEIWLSEKETQEMSKSRIMGSASSVGNRPSWRPASRTVPFSRSR